MMDLSKVTLEELEKLLKRKLKDEADKYFFDLITVLVIWIISHLFLWNFFFKVQNFKYKDNIWNTGF